MHVKLNRDIVKKILLCFLTFSSYFLGISFFIHSQSLFLEKIGPEQLPFVMVVGAGLVIVYSLVSSVLSARLSAPLRFAIFTIIICMAFCGVYLLPGNGYMQVLFFFLICGFLFDFLDISIMNVSSALMTPLQAKNLLPLLNSFNSLGVITGSYFALQIQEYSELFGIGILPAISLLVVILIALMTTKIFRRDLMGNQNSAVSSQSRPRKAISEAVRFITTQSRLFKTLAFVIFLFVAIRISVDFKLKSTISLNFTGDELTEIFGKIYMVESALTFLIDFFLTRHLLFRFGVQKILFLYPIIMSVFLFLAIVFGLQPFFVIMFALSCSVPWYSSVFVATSQIYAIAPQQKGQQIYFLIMGLLSSLTKLAIALSLFVYSANIELEKTYNTGLIVFLIIVLLIVIVKLKKYYQTELKENLFKNDSYLKHQAIELLAEKNQRNKGELYLRRLMNMRGTDRETRLKTMGSLAVIGNYQSIADFIKVLKEGSPREMFCALQGIGAIIKSRKKFDHYPITKHLLLKTYRDIFISDAPHYLKMEIISSLKYFNLEDIIDFLEKNLLSDDLQVKINTIETLSSFDDRGVIPYLEPYLNNDDVRVVASAVIALWRFPDMRVCLIPKLAKIISDKSTEAILSSLYLIGSIGAFWEKKYVRKLTESDDPLVRRYAYVAMISIGGKKYMNNLLKDLVDISRRTFLDKGKSEVNNGEVEYILSQYRKFTPENRELFIAKAQQLSEEDGRFVYEAFAHSRYMFIRELDDLSL